MEKSNYEKLAAIDVSAHIEKKQNLSYLSWAWAVDQLLRADSTANWAYNEPVRFPDDSVMVSCTVTAFGKPMTMHLPVMDFRNKAVKNPDAFAVNTAMMRCLVKAIALHGLGLYIYAGEDLPLSDEPQDDVKAAKHKPTQDTTFKPDAEEETFLLSVVDSILASKDDIPTASDLFYKQNLDNDQQVWIWDRLGKESTLRRLIKEHHKKEQ